MTDSSNSSAPLLLEIGCEDLPARYVLTLAEALSQGLVTGLTKRGIVPAGSTGYATPRRIAVQLEDLALRQPDQTIERSGPALSAAIKDGQPTPAALGFAKTCGVEFSELTEKNGKLHFSKQQPGKATADLLPEIFEETLKAMDELVPKRMRWGSGTETFVRPVQWLVALLGNDVIPLRRFGVEAGRLTYGHRFHAPAAIPLATPADYAPSLLKAKVWADVASRRAEIQRQIVAEAGKLGGTPKISDDLLDEVTALVEWPVVISGRIEERFLELPPEVIVATVETNQRYFTVFAPQPQREGQMKLELGYLMPAFITISNIQSKDVAQVIEGNERVVRPRLSDALFFWQQDLRLPLESYQAKLNDVRYQAGLGSIADKAIRTAILADWIVDRLGKVEADSTDTMAAQGDLQVAVRSAIVLCKNDLVTKMVYEFPELQGVMGGYYAAKSGKSPAVATAIREHYLPTQAGMPIPSTVEGRIVALADKLDTLAGIFAIGQKPTASKDPFALRRAALGVLRILIEGELALDLGDLLTRALEIQPAGKRDEATHKELFGFVMERLRAYLVGTEWLGHPIAVEEFEAVHALGITQPLDFQRRLQALHGFLRLPAAQSLTAAHKRIRNILKQASVTAAGAIDATKFAHPAEATLHAALMALPEGGGYSEQLTRLANLREPVDAFFDMRTAAGEPVMVNDPDPAIRANRLALLAALDARCRSVADISLLPG